MSGKRGEGSKQPRKLTYSAYDFAASDESSDDEPFALEINKQSLDDHTANPTAITNAGIYVDSDSSSDDDFIQVMPPTAAMPQRTNAVSSYASKIKSRASATSTAPAAASLPSTLLSSSSTSSSSLKNQRQWGAYQVLDSSDSSNGSDDDDGKMPGRPQSALLSRGRAVAATTKTNSANRSNLQCNSKTTSGSTSLSAASSATTARRRRPSLSRPVQSALAVSAAKRAEKERKQRQREDARKERERQRTSKKRQTQQAQQANGRFAHKETVVLMDPALRENGEFALHTVLSENFLLHSHTSNLTGCNRAIQWIRRDYVTGGADAALEGFEKDDPTAYEHIRRVLVFMDADQFIPLLQGDASQNDGNQDDYPALSDFVSKLISSWQKAWNTNTHPKISLLLYRMQESLDEMWVERGKTNTGRTRRRADAASATNTDTPLPTESILQDAIQWLLIQFRVESIHCTTPEMLQSAVFKMTRAIAEAPYKTHVTELQCIKKIKMTEGADRTDFGKAKDTWSRQLQCFPRLSEMMAHNVVRHFPTPQSLMEAYAACDDEQQARNLLAGVFSNARRNNALSQSVHRFFRSDDPKDMV